MVSGAGRECRGLPGVLPERRRADRNLARHRLELVARRPIAVAFGWPCFSGPQLPCSASARHRAPQAAVGGLRSEEDVAQLPGARRIDTSSCPGRHEMCTRSTVTPASAISTASPDHDVQRHAASADSPDLTFGAFTLDWQTRQLLRGTRPVPLLAKGTRADRDAGRTAACGGVQGRNPSAAMA